MNRFEEIYQEARSDKWFQRFAVFCRFALAASFIPTGIVKIRGERFAEGLPHNNPLGHYFDALSQTGYYYTFIGIIQIVIAVLLLIERTSLLGVLMYFPIIVNITVLTYATRFDGTRLITMMLLASLYLLIWDYDRIKHILPFKTGKNAPAAVIKKPLGFRLRFIFFGGCIVALAILIIGTSYLYEIGPGNSEEECRHCASSKYPAACENFCDCIYKKGRPLDSCLAAYDQAKKFIKPGGK